MKSDEVAWVAGLFEGEGCITKGKNCINTTMVSTDRDVLDRLNSFFPAPSGVQVRQASSVSKNPKPQYVWRLSKTSEVRMFLKIIFPWLLERRKARAALALEYLSNRR
jgi:hypothetical protein